MKKNLFIAAMGLLVLAGCSSNEDEINNIIANNDNAITFDTYVGKVTKALDKGNFINDDAFGVLASHYTGTFSTFDANFMGNTKIVYTEGWDYATPTDAKYWPNDENNKLAFIAYFPYSETAPTITAGAMKIPFTVEDTPANQKDLMWSTIIEATKTDKDGTKTNGANNNADATKTSFLFKHALSKVEFKAKLGAVSYSGATIKVTNVKIGEIANSSNFTINSTLTDGTWDASPSGTKDYTLTEETAVSSDSPVSVGTSLLMIPQSIASKKVILSYAVSYENPTTTITETKEVTLTGTWDANKHYTYTFVISLEGVTFEATASAWGEVVNKDI